MVSPLNLAPIDTPASVYEVSTVLALYVFPALFLLVSLFMLLARVPRPPYFSYFCAFGALGSMSLCLATGNNPLSAIAFLIAFPLCPLLMVRNLSVLRSHPEQSIFHAGARWASLFSLTIIGLLILWTAFDVCFPKA
jgi:hypothetical protein